MHENEVGRIVVDRAVKLHMATGPGLFESVYEAVLTGMLEDTGLLVERQKVIPVEIFGQRFKDGFRADLVVEGKVIVELKSVPKICTSHQKQVLTYLKLSGLKLGLLLNFGESKMKDGITRIINGKL